MTRELIEDFREIILPFVKKRLLETNYEGLGEFDAEMFAKDFNEILDLAIKALEQEPCEDVISRQAALDCFTATKLKKFDFILYAREEIKKLPSVKPQKTGHWINQHIIYANATIDFKVCSECRYEFSYDAETGIANANYCPNCGTRMESEI